MADSIEKILDDTKENKHIFDSFLKANSVLAGYSNPCCSISGGKDSDIMLDLLTHIDPEKRIQYVWFNTGIEYEATKQHLDYLEQKYGIKIHREKAIKPIPLSCREFGQPFLSKRVSDMIERLQRHNFQWEDEPYDVLVQKYPRCITAIGWWTNHFESIQFNIDYNRYLKEFLLLNPPSFKISSKCCEYAKKKVAHKFNKQMHCDLNITGVRRAERGVRSSAYKSCFTNKSDKNAPDEYRPLFWYENEDESAYDKLFNVLHSRCYSEYGLKRTGCVGCPFARNLDEELRVINQYEPKLYKAVNFVFKDSYAYTEKFRKFVSDKKLEENNYHEK